MLFWPAVTVFGFAVVAAVVVALGSSSTARYELERSGAQARSRAAAVAAEAPAAAGGRPDLAPSRALPGESMPAESASGTEEQRQTQGAAVGVVTQPVAQPVMQPSNHPAGRRLGDGAGAGAPAWWLVEEDSDEPVAGPFADRVEADWAVLGHSLDEATQVVYGSQRPDGGVVRRQLPQERAWLTDLGEQLDRLPADWDELMTDDDALTTLLVEIAAAVVEAGLPLHDCIGDAASGGICLSPGPAHAGVLVTWHQHDRMAVQQVRGGAMNAAVQRAMDAALADLLTTLGFEVEPFGDGGASFVTGFASC